MGCLFDFEIEVEKIEAKNSQEGNRSKDLSVPVWY
jgi:hypothetical protein